MIRSDVIAAVLALAGSVAAFSPSTQAPSAQDGPPQFVPPADAPTIEELERDPRVWGKGDFGGFFERGPKPTSAPVVLHDWLAVRSSANVDVERELVRRALDPTSAIPSADAALDANAVEPRWIAMTSDAPSDVALAFTTVTLDAPCVRMADLQGAELLVVNGECFTGDPERRGFRGVPIALRRGVNRLFVARVRESFSLTLWEPPGELVIGPWDVAWPGFGPTDDDHDVSYPIFNASRSPASGLHLHYGHAVARSASCVPRLGEWCDASEPYLPQLSMRLGSHYWFDLAGRDNACRTPAELSPVCVFTDDPARADRRILFKPPGVTSGIGPYSLRTNASAPGAWLSELEAAPVLVYGTHGTPHETFALLALARFDQQSAWYRTRSTPTILSDWQYLKLLERGDISHLDEVPFSGRGRMRAVVLYGHADSNSAWKLRVSDEDSIDARASSLHIPGRTLEGDDVFGWFLPKSSARRVLAVVATGVRGARAAALVRCLTEPLESSSHAFWRVEPAAPRGRRELAKL